MAKKKRSRMVDGGPVPTSFVRQMRRRKLILQEMQQWLQLYRSVKLDGSWQLYILDRATITVLLKDAAQLVRQTLRNNRVMP